MAHLSRALAFILSVTFLVAGNATAQYPKLGNSKYVDTASLGFHVRVPADWELIPPAPGEPNLIAKYDPPVNKYVQVGKDASNYPIYVYLHCWLVKFDRRPAPEEDKKPGMRIASKPVKDLAAWLKAEVPDGAKLKLDSEKTFTTDKIEATEYQYTTPGDPDSSTRYYACVYKLHPDVDVAMVFSAPGDPKKWIKWENPFKTMSRSFGREELKTIAGGVAEGETLRDKKRAELNRTIATQPGWKLYETPNYFVLTPHEDRAFVQELLKRLEAIRAIYEEDYPAAKAEEYKKIGEGTKTGDANTAEKAAEKAMNDILNEGADPREMSKCSVVRVLTDQSSYHSYGGPGGSAGYWSPYHKELVLYDDQAGGGRNDTWAVLNHEAFHQYIFYFYGNISPHSWYNEGTGDFYSGYTWKNNRFILEKFSWRVQTIKDAVRERTYCDLPTFVRWTQAEYYGNNDRQLGGGQNYAQGWSLIYFLRTGKKANAKGWNSDWDNILETYLRVLAMSGKLDQAVDEAFKGVDMQALEAAWADYTR
ncbi:MAG: hypothetical protein JNL28_08665 [Planctomycetes bacterium]|nr:hypothetical protein [Planctomycetota bacterium]